MKSHRLTAERY